MDIRVLPCENNSTVQTETFKVAQKVSIHDDTKIIFKLQTV